MEETIVFVDAGFLSKLSKYIKLTKQDFENCSLSDKK